MSETPIGEALVEIKNQIRNIAEKQEDMKRDNAAKHNELKTEINAKTKELKDDFNDAIDEIKENFLLRIEFTPVKIITYTIVGIVGGAALLAIANSVIHAIAPN